MNKNIVLAAAGLSAALVIGGTAFSASASVPDSSGTIHGCYGSGGSLKVIDTSVTLTCPRGYRKLNWNQTGPVGPPGPGLTWTTTPTLPQPGSYFVDVEGIIGPIATAVSGNCSVFSQLNPGSVDGYAGGFATPIDTSTNFSFSGMVTYLGGPGAAALDVQCVDTTGNSVVPAAVKWWVTPIATS